jgi:hypothetical protein
MPFESIPDDLVALRYPKLAELFMVFDQKLEKLTIELNHRIDRLEMKNGDDHVALVSNVISHIDEFTAAATAAH